MRTNDISCGWLSSMPQVASAVDTLYGSEGWGFVREVASELHIPRGDEEALVTQPD